MQNRILINIFLFSISIITLVSIQIILNKSFVFPISQSFVKQEIVNVPHDWQFWKDPNQISPITLHNGHRIEVENAKNISQCNIPNRQQLIFPKIDSVSYISDGNILNGTLWLTDMFKEPSLNDSVDIHQGYLQIKVSNLSQITVSSNNDLENYVDEKIASMYNPFNNFTIDENKSPAIISGNKAFKLVYNAITEDGIDVKNMTFWTMKNGKVYDITYSSLNDRYSDNIPTIQKMINSIEIKDGLYTHNSNNDSLIKKTLAYTLFQGFGIKIIYPTDWSKEVEKDASDKGSKIIIFKAPFEDEALEIPSWQEIKFGMALAIDSIQHPSITDYRIEYSREPHVNNSVNNGIISSWLWNKKFYEVSSSDRIRVLEMEKNYKSFYDKKNPYYIFYSVDLRKINFPQQYRAVFYITDYFILKHHLCRLVDTTPWVIIPPPEFLISTTTNTASNTLQMRPGEERNIEFMMKGNTHLPSEVFLTPVYHNNHENSSYNQQVIQASFIPNRTFISPYGSTFFNLHIKALENASESNPYTVTVPISANISFPTTITNRAGEIFNNSKSVNILQVSNLTLTILPSYSLGEKFNNFINTWISPISGLWTFLAGVAAVLAPLVIRIYKKRSKK